MGYRLGWSLAVAECMQYFHSTADRSVPRLRGPVRHWRRRGNVCLFYRRGKSRLASFENVYFVFRCLSGHPNQHETQYRYDFLEELSFSPLPAGWTHSLAPDITGCNHCFYNNLLDFV